MGGYGDGSDDYKRNEGAAATSIDQITLTVTFETRENF
jgi:hypothetical protein